MHRSGVRTVADLFTPRNLDAVARLWDAARRVKPDVLRARALFAVTAVMVRASRLIKYIPSRRIAPGPILGTMYLPSFSAEINVLDMFRRRINALGRAAEQIPADAAGNLCVSTQSASDLSNVPDASVDYVFTDPPFGHNLLYSDLNFLWESWLGWRTDREHEAVVSRSQQKGVGEYGGLMAAAFAEIHRVLRPGRWMTLVFHNTQADVWEAIRRGVEAAGFRIESIQTLDKSHETFKQVTAEGAVGYDVVVNARTRRSSCGLRPPRHSRGHPEEGASRDGWPGLRPGGPGGAAGGSSTELDPVVILRCLLDAAPDGPCKQRTARYLHARLTGELMRSGAPMTLDYRDVLALLHEHFDADGKHWFRRGGR